MNNQIKIIVSWILIALGVAIHVIFELSETINFKPLPKEPLNDGLPALAHISFISALILPMVLSFLTLFNTSKTFKTISMIYALLLALLNLVHVVLTVIGQLTNYTQVLLVVFVAIMNIVLVATINKWRNE